MFSNTGSNYFKSPLIIKVEVFVCTIHCSIKMMYYVERKALDDLEKQDGGVVFRTEMEE